MMNNRTPATGTLQFYRDRAREAMEQAASTKLENVRMRCLRAAQAWEVLAGRIERTDALRQSREATGAEPMPRQEPQQASDDTHHRKAIPFGDWLQTQAQRDDRVGVLARAIRSDGVFPRGNPESVRTRLETMAVDDEMFRALEDAELDWIRP